MYPRIAGINRRKNQFCVVLYLKHVSWTNQQRSKTTQSSLNIFIYFCSNNATALQANTVNTAINSNSLTRRVSDV